MHARLDAAAAGRCNNRMPPPADWFPGPAASLAVVAGGGAGAWVRFAVQRLFAAGPDAFPWPTFGINVAGSILLGVLVVACRDRPTLALLAGTGFCGGFTTFSTFSIELVRLLEQGRPAAAVGYAAGSVLAGVAGAAIGVRLAAAVPPP